MGNPRYIQTDQHSFYGDYLYEQIVPENHFLRKLDALIDWSYYTKKLTKLYKGEGLAGRSTYDPALLLRSLLISYLYNLSERQTEVYLNENLPAKWFVGLAVDQKAPDHSTLSVYRERLRRREKLKVLEEMLAEIVETARKHGVHFGTIQIIDSVHSEANVNTDKDDPEDPEDPDARWGVKHRQKVQTPEGKEEVRTDYFYGYKTHVSMNAESNLITGLEVSRGNAWDGKHFTSLVDVDMKQVLPVETYAADRGYDDGNNHFYLGYKGLHSAILLKDNRLKKKDSNKEVWQELVRTEEYQQGKRERYKIERKFGEAKLRHGFGRCRYIGLEKYGVQAYLTAIVLNLKRMVKLISGVGFNCPGYGTC
jgi:IS5 family transposase